MGFLTRLSVQRVCIATTQKRFAPGPIWEMTFVHLNRWVTRAGDGCNLCGICHLADAMRLFFQVSKSAEIAESAEMQ